MPDRSPHAVLLCLRSADVRSFCQPEDTCHNRMSWQRCEVLATSTRKSEVATPQRTGAKKKTDISAAESTRRGPRLGPRAESAVKHRKKKACCGTRAENRIFKIMKQRSPGLEASMWRNCVFGEFTVNEMRKHAGCVPRSLVFGLQVF